MTGAAVVAGRGEPSVQRLGVMRRAMARHATGAAAVPVFYLRVTADVSALLAARASMSPRPTVNDAVVRAVALALRAHPHVNSEWADGVVHAYPRVNVGVAVAVPGGLVVPAIHDADGLSVAEIASATRAVADLALRRKLPRSLLEDVTFTVSNLGMHGIEDFDPLINAPQAAILGVGAAKDGRMRLTLGCDHRVLTGAEAAPFLGDVKARLERGEELLSS